MWNLGNKLRWVSTVSVIAAVAVGTVIAWISLGQSEASTDPGQPVSPTQVAMLAAQPPIPAAYLGPVEATQRCLEDAGLKAVTHSFDAAGKVSFAWGGFATRAEAQAAGEAYKTCYFQNMDDIDRMWQQSPEVEAAATQRGGDVMKCVEATKAGFRFSSDAAAVPGEMLRLEQSGDPAAATCLAAAGTSMVKYSPLPR